MYTKKFKKQIGYELSLPQVLDTWSTTERFELLSNQIYKLDLLCMKSPSLYLIAKKIILRFNHTELIDQEER